MKNTYQLSISGVRESFREELHRYHEALSEPAPSHQPCLSFGPFGRQGFERLAKPSEWADLAVQPPSNPWQVGDLLNFCCAHLCSRCAASSTVGEDGEERGDLIKFYNAVFLPLVQVDFLIHKIFDTNVLRTLFISLLYASRSTLYDSRDRQVQASLASTCLHSLPFLSLGQTHALPDARFVFQRC